MRNPIVAVVLLAALAGPAAALDRATVGRLATGDSEEKIAAIAALVTEGDPRAVAVLQAFGDGELQFTGAGAGARVLIVKGKAATDAVTGEKVAPLPAAREDVLVNNRLRGAVQGALAAFKLGAADGAPALTRGKECAGGADEAMLPLVKKALSRESDAAIRTLLEQIAATLELKGGTKESRIAAIRTLGESSNASAKTLLLAVLQDEKDPDIRLQ